MTSRQKILLYSFLYLVSAAILVSPFLLHPAQRDPVPIVRTIIVLFATILLSKYFVYMTLSPMYDVWRRLRDHRYARVIRTWHPKVSVIVPSWNEEVGILRTVESVLANEYLGPLEVVVVNDGSTDGSDALMRQAVAQYEATGTEHPQRTLLYEYKPRGGKGAALNRAIQLSSGEIIVSIDADCVVATDAIANFVKCFADPKVMAAVGNVKIGNDASVLGTVQYLEFLFSFYFKKADSLLNTIYIIGGAAGAFRREVFDIVGLYSPTHITEDIDLSVRIQKAGLRIVYADDAVVYTEGASDLKGLMRQRLRWKRGRFQTFWEHRLLFFSPKKGRSRLLTQVVLPLAALGDVQLLGELLFIVFLFFYSFWTDNFSYFISGIIVVSLMFAVQLADDRDRAKSLGFLALAPIGWMLFYISTFVEHSALLESLLGMIKGQRVRWQRWQRQGLAK